MKRTDRELLADALKLIEYGIRGGEAHDITEEIRARLAEPADEPAAWMDIDGNVSDNNDCNCFPIPLYSRPRQPARLSDEEIENLFEENPIGKHPRIAIARAIEKAILEKNQ